MEKPAITNNRDSCLKMPANRATWAANNPDKAREVRTNNQRRKRQKERNEIIWLPMVISKPCQECKKYFTILPRGKVRGKERVYCSTKCKRRCGNRKYKNNEPDRRNIHKLSDINSTRKIALCNQCGFTTILKNGKGWICKTLVKEREWRRSGISLSVNRYSEMVLEQEGRCKICSKPMHYNIQEPTVDHCHTTGRIRALLCINCNNGLGRFGDEINMMQKAIQYLEDYQ